MQRIVFVIAVYMFLALTGCTKAEPVIKKTVVRENSAAPDILLTSFADGSKLKLSSLKGKVVLLNFWATWCPPCREEIPSMMKLNSAMSGKPFQMIAVSIDEGGNKDVESFFKASGLKLPTFFDVDGSATKVYGITGVPESFIIDKNGVLIKKVIGGFAWDSPEAVSFFDGLMK